MSKDDKKYHDLLQALIEYVKANGDEKLDAFLAGYVGDDWRAAKGK